MNALERIDTSLKSLEDSLDRKIQKKLDLKLLKRIALRFHEFSPQCKECKTLMKEMDPYLKGLVENKNRIDKGILKAHFKTKSRYVGHLNRNHELIQLGQNTGLWMSLGVSIGVFLGLTTFDNLAIGLPIGMSIGLLIGSSKDALAKKKDKVI